MEIALKAGDLDRARVAVEQLAELVEESSPPAIRAALAYARGRVLLADGDETASARELQAALRQWREVGSTYEIARTRAALSRALRVVGDDDDADLELRVARDEFERLGAKPDLAAVETELRELEERRTGRAQVRRAFLFTDIVGSTAARSSTRPVTGSSSYSIPHGRRSAARLRSSVRLPRMR